MFERVNAFLSGRHRGTEWTPIYMLVVIVIAAIVIISLVKPAFILASQRADEANDQTLNAARNALFILAWPLRKSASKHGKGP